jgi:hypothetical protein
VREKEPATREKRNGSARLPGHEPGLNRVADRVRDRAKDHRPGPGPRRPGKAVIHLFGTGGDLHSAQTADRKIDLTKIGEGVRLRAALPVAAPNVGKKGVTPKDGHREPATRRGGPRALRTLPKGRQFPFVLARNLPGPQPGRGVLIRQGVQHGAPHAISGKTAGKVWGEMPGEAGAMTGRVQEAAPQTNTRDRNGAAKGHVRPLRQVDGPRNRGSGPARHRVSLEAGRAAGNLAGDRVGNQANHPCASAEANRAGKNQEHDS